MLTGLCVLCTAVVRRGETIEELMANVREKPSRAGSDERLGPGPEPKVQFLEVAAQKVKMKTPVKKTPFTVADFFRIPARLAGLGALVTLVAGVVHGQAAAAFEGPLLEHQAVARLSSLYTPSPSGRPNCYFTGAPCAVSARPLVTFTPLQAAPPGTLAAFGEPPIAVTPNSAPPPDLVGLINSEIQFDSQFIIQPALRSGNSAAYYVTIDPALHGMISAVQSTRDARLMTQLIGFVDAVVGASITISAVNTNRPPYPGWNDTAGGAQADLDAVDTVAVIARAAALIMNNAAWKAQYADKAQRYIQFAVDGGIRRYHTDAYRGKIPWTASTVWDETASHFGVLATCLWQATGQPSYRDLTPCG